MIRNWYNRIPQEAALQVSNLKEDNVNSLKNNINSVVDKETENSKIGREEN